VIWFQKESEDPEQAQEGIYTSILFLSLKHVPSDEVAEIIKDEIWSDPIRYYHGV
jgi:hypothetical protein